MNKVKWKIIKGKGNMVLHKEWGHISYQPNTRVDEFGQMITAYEGLGEKFGLEVREGKPETALCIKCIKNEKKYGDIDFAILNGDFRIEYGMAKSLDECLDIFIKNKDCFSEWSTINLEDYGKSKID